LHYLDLVRFLLDQDADPNILDVDNISCLHTAADNGNLEIAKMLLKNKNLNINHTDNNVSFYI
jgi:ankyrin repeat protein